MRLKQTMNKQNTTAKTGHQTQNKILRVAPNPLGSTEHVWIGCIHI